MARNEKKAKEVKDLSCSMRYLCRAVNDEVIAFHRTNNTDVKRRLMLATSIKLIDQFEELARNIHRER